MKLEIVEARKAKLVEKIKSLSPGGVFIFNKKKFEKRELNTFRYGVKRHWGTLEAGCRFAGVDYVTSQELQRRVTLEKLREFSKLFDGKCNFTDVAKKLGVSRQRVEQHVRQAERLLGVEFKHTILAVI